MYALWRYPALLPIFRTWPPVIQKLLGGAGTIFYFFLIINKNRYLWFHLNCYSLKVSSSIRSHVTRCGAAFKWSPRCAAGRLLCCYSSKQQVCYSISCVELGKIPVLLVENVIIHDDPSAVVIAELLSLLVLLQCPAQRCTALVWKGEEWVFFTRTWIISGEQLSTLCGLVFVWILEIQTRWDYDLATVHSSWKYVTCFLVLDLNIVWPRWASLQSRWLVTFDFHPTGTKKILWWHIIALNGPLNYYCYSHDAVCVIITFCFVSMNKSSIGSHL